MARRGAHDGELAEPEFLFERVEDDQWLGVEPRCLGTTGNDLRSLTGIVLDGTRHFLNPVRWSPPPQ